MTLEEKTATDLEIARQLARDGIPVFIAPPSDDPKDTSGFRLPAGWQQTVPDPAVLDRWQPGWAVCMVTGHGLDLVDLDIYANPDAGKLIEGLVPYRYGAAATASGGVHIFVRSIGVASKNALMPGIDVKAGTAEGKGRGFAFIAPTVKKSKVNGQPATYSWIMPPDAAAARNATEDTSGQPLAERITGSRRHATPPGAANGHQAAAPTVDEFLAQNQPGPWKDIKGTLAGGRNDGVMRLAAALRGQGGWSLEAALKYMYEHVWPHVDQAQAGHEFPAEEFEGIIHAAWRQWEDGAQVAQRAAEQAAQSVPQRGDLPIPEGVLMLTDAYLTDIVVHWCLANPDPEFGGPFLWALGLRWLRWDGRVWAAVDVGVAHDAVRRFFQRWLGYAAQAGAEHTILAKMTTLLSKARITAVTDLAHGHPHVIRDAASFDAYPDLLNTPDGIVDLRTGKVSLHDPGMMLTKITSGSYKPGYRHPDWDTALTALDPPEREWLQRRIGQGITGHPPSDGIMPVLQGGGENGKTALTTDGPVRALGDYADNASHKLITSQRADRSEHSTEMADLRGQRLLIGEELSEGRSIDVTALKRIMDVGTIRARFVHKDNFSFMASHTLFVTSNYVPVINETDHGTWRRLVLLKFPYTFRKRQEQCTRDVDRIAVPGLKQRIRQNASGQHDAIVTWAVEGAQWWYENNFTDAMPTAKIEEDTLSWRKDADKILGFALEMLEPDDSACILATDMLDQFNARLARGGHGPWSVQLFTARFEDHEWTTAHGIRNQRTAALQGLVPWPVPGAFRPVNEAPKQAKVWTRVRPRTPEEQAKPGELAELAGPLTKVSERSSYREFVKHPATPATKINFPGQNGDISEPPGPQDRVQPVVTPKSPLDPESPPEPESPSVTKLKAKAKREPKAKVPDPELAGPVFPLPAIVLRDGRVLPCTTEQAEILVRSADLTVDVETTGYPPGHEHYALRTVQAGRADLAAVFRADDPEQMAAVARLIAGAGILRAHSAAADLVPLALAGACDPEEAWSRMHDTVLAAKLADPAMSGSDANGLKDLSRDVLGEQACAPAADERRAKLFASAGWLKETDPLTPLAKSGWARVDPQCQAMITYAASDVLDTAAVAQQLPAPPPQVYERERKIQRMCARVSHAGLRLDGARVRELTERETALREQAREIVTGRFGVANPGSAQQSAQAFADLGVTLPHTKPSARFPQGQPSVAESVLAAVKQRDDEAGELARAILDYREHATILALTLEPFGVQCAHGDGRARPVVYTMAADTGRMSCRRPNLQQIKREGGYRSCITADPGYLLISADFASVEIRVAAALSGDPALIDMIRMGDAYPERKQEFDLHWRVNRMVWGDQATKSTRYGIKRAVFGHMYGGAAEAMANGAGIPLEAAQGVKRSLAALAPGYTGWDRQMRQYVRDGGRVFPAYSGRPIWLPKRMHHAAGNYAIQGSARELLADALEKWETTPWGGCVILPVHDELIAMVREDEAAAATEALVACMRTELHGVPIVAEASEPSFAWQDAA